MSCMKDTSQRFWDYVYFQFDVLLMTIYGNPRLKKF